MKRTVVFISSSALDAQGRPGPFLAQELPWLLAHFDRVLVCDKTGVANAQADVSAPLPVRRPALGALRAALCAPFDKNLWRELRHLAHDGLLTPVSAAKLFAFTLRGHALRCWVQAALPAGEQATLYAYWMSYDGYAAAMLKRQRPALRAVARAHAFDIDPARNPLNQYLMKRMIARTLDGLYPIGEGARAHIAPYAPPEKVTVLGMGSAGGDPPHIFPAPVYQDGVFRMVSCSAIVPVKQLPLIVDMLALWPRGPVRWLHIGGGAGEAALRAYAAKVLGTRHDIEFTITGQVEPARVADIYRTHPFDVFVNVSQNEGVPVAIMEAMRVGLPTVAPALGGIPELVDAETGVLYPPQGGAQAVLAALLSVAHLPPAKAEAMRRAAQARWNERCRVDRLLPRLFPEATERVEAQP
jgi:glycosyltransferase involved in cell wall biosynthesis